MFEIGGERRGFGRPPLGVLAACLQLVTKVGRQQPACKPPKTDPTLPRAVMCRWEH